MHKGTKLQIAHKYVCLIQWTAWFIGIVLTWIWRFVPGFDTYDFFFEVVDPYVMPVMCVSLIPVEPVLFIGVVIQAFRRKLEEEKLPVHFLLFAAHIALFLTFLMLFVAWTGGV